MVVIIFSFSNKWSHETFNFNLRGKKEVKIEMITRQGRPYSSQPLLQHNSGSEWKLHASIPNYKDIHYFPAGNPGVEGATCSASTPNSNFLGTEVNQSRGVGRSSRCSVSRDSPRQLVAITPNNLTITAGTAVIIT
jgi:hypothetical protein